MLATLSVSLPASAGKGERGNSNRAHQANAAGLKGHDRADFMKKKYRHHKKSKPSATPILVREVRTGPALPPPAPAQAR